MMSTVRPVLRLLNSSQILDIHNASVQILSKTGVRIDSRNARELLVKAGCRNDPGNRIFFTEEIIDMRSKAPLINLTYTIDPVRKNGRLAKMRLISLYLESE